MENTQIFDGEFGRPPARRLSLRCVASPGTDAIRWKKGAHGVPDTCNCASVFALSVRDAYIHAMRYVGVDACKVGWFAVRLGGDGPEYRVCGTFAEVWDWTGEDAILFVDIPIGLPDRGARLADREARQALPAHLKSTIFNTPVRRAVYAGSKEEARQINRQLSGKSLSEQSLGIMKKIKDVDSFLQVHPEAVGVVFESHPETCFGRLAGRFPAHGKKDLLGGMERFRIVREFIPNLEDFLVAVRRDHPRSRVASDDVLDGCILAVTARECGGTPRFLPAGSDGPPRDETGLPMAIWYHES